MKKRAICPDGSNSGDIQTGSIKITVRLFDGVKAGEDDGIFDENMTD